MISMSLPLYNLIHLIAIMVLFAGIGASLAGADHAGTRKFGAILRGIALLLLLVSGFGMLSKLNFMKNMPLWSWIKVVIWLVIAMLPVIVKRKKLSATAAVVIALALGGIAAWLGYGHDHLPLWHSLLRPLF